MRQTFADTFFELGCDDDRLAVVVADISPAGSISKFRDEFPDRFINTGVAEQIMIGICGGMALRGLRPFAYTIATFALLRPYEFVRDDLCYQNLPVTVVGIGGGVNYSTLGTTHQAVEDVALTMTLPNMQVLAPCDPLEVREATTWCAKENQGPAYMRLARAGEPVLTDTAPDSWRFGKIRYLQRGTDVCILTYGALMKQALEVAAALSEKGKSVSVVSVHTLKPLDLDGLRGALSAHEEVIVMEELLPNGGLSHRVKELAWDTNATCKLSTFTLQDAFLHFYGSHEQLLAAHGLSPNAILAKLGYL
ncbi:transketolase [Alphaproteobacteria bacterium]|nr:transketolase [Alphaproteobacteria bacterium]